APVSTKIPAPIMAPMPSVVKFIALNARLRPCSADASCLSSAMDFLARSGLAIFASDDLIEVSDHLFRGQLSYFLLPRLVNIALRLCRLPSAPQEIDRHARSHNCQAG